jgi:hypothetical protein
MDNAETEGMLPHILDRAREDDRGGCFSPRWVITRLAILGTAAFLGSQYWPGWAGGHTDSCNDIPTAHATLDVGDSFTLNDAGPTISNDGVENFSVNPGTTGELEEVSTRLPLGVDADYLEDQPVLSTTPPSTVNRHTPPF